MFFRILLSGILLLSIFPAPSIAEDDDVLTTVEEAVKQYTAGDFAAAASNLDYASQLVRQKRSEITKRLLPKALPGWQAGEPESQTVASGVLGGGVTVSREYTKGPATITIEIVSDSPVLQSVLMMINNPLFAGAGGGKLERVNTQRAVVKYDGDDKSGELFIVVNNQFLVTVSGKAVERRDLLDYAGALDYFALSQN
ncbi:MAG: hypothetical protein CSA21_03045 [Deltaproteobacteria bacterium]|nr:MAG: hypothetical protein CSA21_03045 [Deltaproteobacteria bacterium]